MEVFTACLMTGCNDYVPPNSGVCPIPLVVTTVTTTTPLPPAIPHHLIHFRRTHGHKPLKLT
jgi:hypothetical protein